MTIKSRLAKLEQTMRPHGTIGAETEKLDRYIQYSRDVEQTRAAIIDKLEAVLAGDISLQAYPNTPEKAFILERLNRIAEVYQCQSKAD